MSPILQRITAWLCLTVALLCGVTPVQGFVLCLEPDGGVCFGNANPGERCGGCHADTNAAGATSTVAASTEDPCCACVDLVVPAHASDEYVQPKALDPHVPSWIAAPRRFVFASAAAGPATVRPPPIEEPRPPDSLALVRCVVLLV